MQIAGWFDCKWGLGCVITRTRWNRTLESGVNYVWANQRWSILKMDFWLQNKKQQANPVAPASYCSGSVALLSWEMTYWSLNVWKLFMWSGDAARCWWCFSAAKTSVLNHSCKVTLLLLLLWKVIISLRPQFGLLGELLLNFAAGSLSRRCVCSAAKSFAEVRLAASLINLDAQTWTMAK